MTELLSSWQTHVELNHPLAPYFQDSMANHARHRCGKRQRTGNGLPLSKKDKNIPYLLVSAEGSKVSVQFDRKLLDAAKTNSEGDNCRLESDARPNTLFTAALIDFAVAICKHFLNFFLILEVLNGLRIFLYQFFQSLFGRNMLSSAMVEFSNSKIVRGDAFLTFKELFFSLSGIL
jgi:hypothetical protein